MALKSCISPSIIRFRQQLNKLNNAYIHDSASQPKIRFLVRYLTGLYGDNCYEKQQDTNKTDYKDLLPSTWERYMAGSDRTSGCYLEEFRAPKSEITQEIISKMEDFASPDLKNSMNNSFGDAYVVVAVVVISIEGGKCEWHEPDFIPMIKSRWEFDERIDEIFDGHCGIFDGYYGGWKRSHRCFESKISKDGSYQRTERKIFYGPKCEVEDKMEQLQMFMDSDQYKRMQPWINLESFEVEDPLNEINGLSY